MSEAAVIELIATLGAPQPIDEDWAEKARCPETDPEAFFPEKGGSTKEAKKVCQRCPVTKECLQWALDNDERFGVWGGLSERERRRLQRGLDPNRATDGEIAEPHALPAIVAPAAGYQGARLAG